MGLSGHHGIGVGIGVACCGVMRHRMSELTDDEPRYKQQNYRPALKGMASHLQSLSPLRQGRNLRAAPEGFPYSYAINPGQICSRLQGVRLNGLQGELIG